MAKIGIEAALDRLARTLKSGRPPGEVITRLDRDLASLRLSIPLYLASTPFGPDNWVLGYDQLPETGWRLVARPAADDQPVQPLADLSPSIQLAALDIVPQLLEELCGQIHVALRGIEWARQIPRLHPRLAREARRRRRRDE